MNISPPPCNSIAREEKYTARREPPQSQSGRQLNAHRDLVDPFSASQPYHRIWFHERMKSFSQRVGLSCPIASIDLLVRDLRQIIEGPSITENSGPLSDKKLSSSIYFGGWLWEGFREIQRRHLKQEEQERQSKTAANRKRSLSTLLDHTQPPTETEALHPVASVTSNLIVPPMTAQATGFQGIGFMNGFPVPVAAMAPTYYSGQMMGHYRPPPPVFMGQQIHAAVGPAPTGIGGAPPTTY